MHRLLHITIAITIPVTFVGCSVDTGSGPFGAAKESALLSSYSGDWKFDFEKTLQLREQAGASDEEIDAIRQIYAQSPQLGKMHPDMTITGDVAVGDGFPASEYRFFAMHEHDGKVCGKAWHHEDRHDPGDMTKCYTRLSLNGDHLYLEVRMQEQVDLNDPDLQSTPVTEGGSAEECDADDPADPDWSEWMTYAFSHK